MHIVHSYDRARKELVTVWGRSDHSHFRPGDNLDVLDGKTQGIRESARVAAVALRLIDKEPRLVLTLEAPLAADPAQAKNAGAAKPDLIFNRNARMP